MKFKMAFPQRKWVITALVGFLVVMLLLTFFSNTIMNNSLPQVRTRWPSQGTLSSSVTAEGPIEAIMEEVVESPGNRVVEEVFVQMGEEVEEGQPLLSLVAAAESDELLQAEAELAELIWARNWDLKMREPVDNSHLEEAVTQAEKMLKTLRENLANLQNEPALVQQIAALKKDVQRYEERILVLGLELESLGTLESLTNDLNAAQLLCDQKKTDFEDAQTAYEDALLDPTVLPEDLEDLLAAKDLAEIEYNNAKKALANTQKQYDAFAKEVQKRQTELANVSMQKATAESQILDLEFLITGGDIEEAKDAIKAGEKAVTDAKKSLERQKLLDQKNAEEQKRSDEQAIKTIEEKEKAVQDLRDAMATNVILSPAGGLVAAVNVKDGDELVPEMEMITVYRHTEGYRVTSSFAIDIASTFYVGMTARVDEPWMAENREAVVTSIRVDPDAPSTKRLVTFRLNGIFYPNQTARLSMNNFSRGYECVIPKSAFHTDSVGPFIYGLREKSSPLGMRYYAIRVNVTVLAEEGTSVAIEPSALQDINYVIIQSNRPIEDGSQVRLADSNS